MHHICTLLKVHVGICPSCSGVRSLGSADDEGDSSAASWVIRMKMLEEEKKKAEKKVSLISSLHTHVVLTYLICVLLWSAGQYKAFG